MERLLASPRRRIMLTVLLVVVLAALGFAALAHLLREVHLYDVRHAFAAIGTERFLLAIMLTVASYLA